jgi:triphosphatase
MTTRTMPTIAQDGLSQVPQSPRPKRQGLRGQVVLKIKSITLNHDATLDDAIAAIIASVRDHWVANDTAARQGRDIEGVHQVRVSLRRFRSAMTVFKAFIPSTQREWLNGEARWLLSELGPVRDLDVFTTELLPAVMREAAQPQDARMLTRALRAAKLLAQGKACAALESARAQLFLRRLETWLMGHGWRIATPDAVKDTRTILARDFALRALNKRLIKILAHGKGIDKLPIAELHEIRIAVKKIRYGAEFFQAILPKRRAAKLATLLKELQDSLGHLNDLDVAEQIVSQLTATAKNTKAASAIAAAGVMVVTHHRQAADDAVHGIAPRWRKLRTFGVI